jgi:DnaJ-class molecular chaperone
MSLKLLGLPASASEAQLKAHWRQLAAKHHPDRGGDPAVFDQLRKQYSVALEEIDQPLPCGICGGSGKLPKTKGFNKLLTRCESCNGLGTWPRG